MNNTTTRQVIIIGHGNEALNAAIVMASLDKPVTLIGRDDDISATLDHYRFERQLLSLWDLYTKEQKISVFAHITPVQEGDCFASLCQADFDRAVIWVFMDMLTEAQLAELPQLLTSPHQQIILSGLTQIGQAHDLAQQFYSHWVYYFPLTFMKDGANFSSMLHPDVVLIGEKTPNSYTHSQELLFFICHAEQHSVADITTVEFSRASLMTMLATRISFMNEMARLADSMGVDIQRVQQMMGLDKRIGKDFLAAGWGFGGRALPAELKGLIDTFSDNQVSNVLVEAVQVINEDQKELIFRKFWRHFDGFIDGKTVVIWGAGYRNGTGRTTHSAIHPLLKLLWSYQIKTLVFATNTAFELNQLYGDTPLFGIIDNPYQSLAHADGLFIINWSELQPPNIDYLNQVAVPIFDAKNVISQADTERLVGDYYGIGRGNKV